MKTLRYLFLLLVLFSVACDRDNCEPPELPEPPVVDAPPCEAIRPRWACMNMPRPVDSYNYTVCEWAGNATFQQMQAACQISPALLEAMSTQAVIQAIWEYPLLQSLFDGGKYQVNFEELFSDNNAWQEIIKRETAGEDMLSRLVLVNVLATTEVLEPQTLEILISQPEILSQLDDGQKKTVVALAVKNDSLRQHTAFPLSERAGIHRAATWLLVGRAMLATGYVPFINAVNGDADLKMYLDGKRPDGSGLDYTSSSHDDILRTLVGYSNAYLDRPDKPFPCLSYSALSPREWARESWAGMNMPRPADSYNYPVYSDMPEWAELTDRERNEASQVPPCVLEKMSTQAVIQAIWECKETTSLLPIQSGASYQRYIERFMAKFNIFRELVARQDAGAALFERLALVDAGASIIARNNTRMLDLIISQPVFLSQLDSRQKHEIVEIYLKNYELEPNAMYGNIRFVLIGRAMYADGYAPFVEIVNGNYHLKAFIDGWHLDGNPFSYYVTPQEIIDFSKEYVKKS